MPIELQLKFLLRYAILAPSARNSQPWLFDVEGDTVRLFANPTVPRPISDPGDRELYLSLGCALENLLVAAEHFGFAHELTYFPSGSWSWLVASVVFRPGPPRPPARPPVTLDAILRRHNDNRPFRHARVPEDVRRALQACCTDPALRLDLTDDRVIHRWVDQLTLEADRAEFADPGFRSELAASISQGVFGTSRMMSRLGALAVAHLDLGEAVSRQDHELVESAGLIGLVSARHDDHWTHVKAGQLFERLWLTATDAGIHVHPMSQTMRHPELRAAVAELLPETGWKPLHLFRIGYPHERGERVRHTPRRPLEDEAD
jgi:nitroreductase